MKKPLLFLDFDGLQFNTTPVTMNYINERYGINSLPFEYADHFNPLDLLKKYGAQHIPTWNEFWLDIGINCIASIKHHEFCQPMEGFVEVVKELSLKYEIWTVTARQKSSHVVVQYLKEKYIPNIITGVHHVWEELPDRTFKSVFKKDFIDTFQGEKIAFIDDSPTEILALQETLPSFLFDPCHVHTKKEDIKIRVHSWYEIGDRLL